MSIVLVIGDTCFLAKYVISELINQNHVVRFLAETGCELEDIPVLGKIDQVQVVSADFKNLTQPTLNQLAEDCEVIINLINKVDSQDPMDYTYYNVKLVEMLIKACTEKQVGRIIQITSRLNSNPASAAYLQSKKLRDEAIASSIPESVIIETPIIYGNGDHFLDIFIKTYEALGYLLVPKIEGHLTIIYAGSLAKEIANLVEAKNIEGAYNCQNEQTLTVETIFAILAKSISREDLPIKTTALSSWGTRFFFWLMRSKLASGMISSFIRSPESLTGLDILKALISQKKVTNDLNELQKNFKICYAR